jgi:hypothetical protein
MSGTKVFDLVCGECGSEYKVRKNNRERGPGAFECQICGEQIFLWTCEVNDDCDFELVRPGNDLGNSR